MWKHWTVRSNTPHQPFQSFQNACWIWPTLKDLFPDALGAVLMPNHMHLILPSHIEVQQIHGILGVMSKKLRIPALWQPIKEVETIPDRLHLRRIVRYIALNPCRGKLCSDPLEWIWSTYRDVMGASVNPWVDDLRLSKALGETARGFRVRFHAYVSGDPSVSINGTQFPHAALPKKMAEEGIREILLSCAAALRVSPEEVKIKNSELRKYFIHLAYRQGWKHPKYLSQICHISPQAIHFHLKKKAWKEISTGISAAALCLGDRRLRMNRLSNLSEYQD